MLITIDQAKKAVDDARVAWLAAIACTHHAHAMRRLTITADDPTGSVDANARVRDAWEREERAFLAYETARMGLHAIAHGCSAPRVVDAAREVANVAADALVLSGLSLLGAAVVGAIESAARGDT